jgi:superfamily II DNA or RNA helicase
MINNTLRKNILLKVLPNAEKSQTGLDFESMDKILNELFPDKKATIKEDRNILGLLHHALNIQNYEKKTFRRMLLKNADEHRLARFLERLKLSSSLPRNEFERDILIDKAVSLPWGTNDATKAFIETFGYDKSIIPIAKKETFPSELLEISVEPLTQLKDYQSEIVFEANRKIEDDYNTRFLIQMPTGSGKTRVACEIIANFFNNSEGKNAVWLADKQELCIQAIENFKNVWKHTGTKKITLHRFWGDYDSMPDTEGSNLVVGGLTKMINHFKKNRRLIESDLIVFDEAHHMAAPEYYKCVKYLSGKTTRIIGLTATPGRGSIGNKNNIELARLFWNNIIKINSGQEGPIEYLQRKKILAVAKKVKIEYYDPKFQFTPREWKQIASSSDYPPQIIKKIASNYIRNLRIAQKLKELGTENKQVLFFAASVEHSRWMFAIAKYMGYTAAHVENSTPSNYRKEVIRKFKNRELNFIFNYDIFTAGFDAPNIDVVFIARPTKSHVTLLQMVGRGMRGPQMGGKERFELVYIEDKVFQDMNLERFYEAFSEYFAETD